ncbi:MAG: hypothetical protein QM537_06190 [Candidatus Symbiobacter sp.]|nr:hypothetical protein [Candidatus Symbiobacter sp.]
METQDFAAFVDKALLKRPEGILQKIGNMREIWIQGIKQHGITLETIEIVVRDRDIAHSFRDAKTNQLPINWYKDLPTHLFNPQAVIFDTTHFNDPALLLIFSDQVPVYKLVIRLNYLVKKKGVYNIVETGHVVDIGGIKAMMHRGYFVIDGSL